MSVPTRRERQLREAFGHRLPGLLLDRSRYDGRCWRCQTPTRRPWRFCPLCVAPLGTDRPSGLAPFQAN